MLKVAILSVSDENGEKSYRAIAGDRFSTGKTAGQAIDALTARLGKTEFSALFAIRNLPPDSFFTAGQRSGIYYAALLIRYERRQNYFRESLLPRFNNVI